MKALLILSFLTLASCGKALDYHVDIDPELAPVVLAFQYAGSINKRPIDLHNITVQFDTNSPLPTTLAGLCETKPRTTVTINKHRWDLLPEVSRRELVFHELGHCILGLHHDDTHKNIMNYTIMGLLVYNENTFSYYDTELFRLTK